MWQEVIFALLESLKQQHAEALALWKKTQPGSTAWFRMQAKVRSLFEMLAIIEEKTQQATEEQQDAKEFLVRMQAKVRSLSEMLAIIEEKIQKATEEEQEIADAAIQAYKDLRKAGGFK